MELLDLMKYRRSIRKYEERQVERETLEKIIEAGLYAPNAGGGQRSIIVGIRNAELAEQIGRFNLARFDRSRLAGSYVSKDQPSVIDDPAMKSGFYGAPCVCVIFGPKQFSTASRMPSAARKIWFWRQRRWAFPPASWQEAKKPLTIQPAQPCCGNGTYLKPTLPAALFCWGIARERIRLQNPENPTEAESSNRAKSRRSTK